jgi:acetyl esterase/lipase
MGVVLGSASCSSSDGGGERDGDRKPDPSVVTYRYGPDAVQVADLHLAPGADDGEPVAVVVLVHGGFWKPTYDRSLMLPLALDLVDRGYLVWNIDYRASGSGGGGWPRTFEDVAAAIDRLAEVADDHPLDLDRVVTVGHSAGGTLALWAAARRGLPAGATGSGPAVEPCGAVSLAGVNNLVAGYYEDLGTGAVKALMGGGPYDDRDAYALASPEDRLPLGVPQIMVHGADDVIVPVAQSSAYAAKATDAGDEVELIEVDGADHFDVIDPGHDLWTQVAGSLADLCG